MSGATFEVPGVIIDIMARGVREMSIPRGFVVASASGRAMQVGWVTDAGNGLLFVRAPDMERT